MYGDTHVEPAPLVDLDAGERPPVDAIEIYFDAPMSLHLLTYGSTQRDDLAHLAAPLLQIRKAATRRAVSAVQQVGGYVLDESWIARQLPARLELSALIQHELAAEYPCPAHVHLYVGRTAQTIADCTRWPVDPDQLRRAADHAWRSYHQALISGAEEAFDFFTWGNLPGHHASEKEIVNPPLVSEADELIRVICPGPYGPDRERIMADERWRIGIRAMERDMAADEARRAAG